MVVHSYTTLVLACFYVACCLSKSIPPTSSQFPEQWQAWKSVHGKNYTSQLEELDRHLVWLSNKKYIESHNVFSHVFGYTLKLNQFADMVSIHLEADQHIQIAMRNAKYMNVVES